MGATSAKPATRAHRAAKPAGGAKAARRTAILSAGLQVFAAHGFEAARLDDVAERAGVAKGTLYLYFRDKTELFEEIIRNAAAPVIASFEAMTQAPQIPTRLLLESLMATFASQVLATERKLVLRLIISEGPRFPNIARFYHEHVVSRGLAVMTRVLERGVARGEVASGALVQFPQLVMAPLLMTLIWDGLFQAIAPIDVPRLLAAHLDIVCPAIPSGERP